MINAIIIDDEKGCVANLKHYLSRYCSELNIVAYGYSVEDAMHIIRTHPVDVAFLDVELMNENIFSFLRNASLHKFEVVFVTAYERYALKALKISALDYILKPLLKADVIACYNKILKRYAEMRGVANVKELRKATNVVIRQGDKVYIIGLDDIFYMKANGVYSQLLFSYNDKQILSTISKPIGELEKEYSNQSFYRVHKSYIVNLKKVSDIIKDEFITLRLSNGIMIPVAKRRTREFLDFLELNK